MIGDLVRIVHNGRSQDRRLNTANISKKHILDVYPNAGSADVTIANPRTGARLRLTGNIKRSYLHFGAHSRTKEFPWSPKGKGNYRLEAIHTVWDHNGQVIAAEVVPRRPRQKAADMIVGPSYTIIHNHYSSVQR